MYINTIQYYRYYKYNLTIIDVLIENQDSFNFAYKNIIEDIVDTVIELYNLSISDDLKQNTINGLQKCCTVLDDWLQDNTNIPDDDLTSIEAVLQLSTQFRNHVTDNKTTFDSEISDDGLDSIITTITDQYRNIEVFSLELPERRFVDGFTNNDRSSLLSAINLFAGNYSQKQVAIALYGFTNEFDVSKMTDMSYLFQSVTNFNEDINDWDVSNVTTMEGMFYGSNFNKPLHKWNVNKVKNAKDMFYEWTGNQNISTSVQSRNDVEYLA